MWGGSASNDVYPSFASGPGPWAQRAFACLTIFQTFGNRQDCLARNAGGGIGSRRARDAVKGRALSEPTQEEAQPQSPAEVRDLRDPGDATQLNFRYQHSYGVILMVAAKLGDPPYIALWCEHHEDLLAEYEDNKFDAYQIKTRRPERGAWTLKDDDLIKSLGRFVDLVAQFGDAIAKCYFVSNAEYDTTTGADQKRLAQCPKDFLKSIHASASPDEIVTPFDKTLTTLASKCGCSESELFKTLKRTDVIVGPSRREFDAALAHEHIARLPGCEELTSKELDRLRDDLVAIVYRASSLHVTDATRHLRPLISGDGVDPALMSKRLVVNDVVVYQPQPSAPSFEFVGPARLDLDQAPPVNVLDLKLLKGGLEDQIDYVSERARSAHFFLLKDLERRPEMYPALLKQVEQIVYGECAEARLRAAQDGEPFGQRMLIQVQDRLHIVAAERAEEIGGLPYECLMGIAGLLTSGCSLWWSPRFPIESHTD
jgi:hypothetical protein